MFGALSLINKLELNPNESDCYVAKKIIKDFREKMVVNALNIKIFSNIKNNCAEQNLEAN